MNGMNKTLYGVVSLIALVYAGLCFALTMEHFTSTDGAALDFFLFWPVGGELGINLTEKAPDFIADVLNSYGDLIDEIAKLFQLDEDTEYYVELSMVVLGFVIMAAGFTTKFSKDVEGTTNPVEYLWTHRPKAFLKCILMPFGLIFGCWMRCKPLIVIPIVLLPLYYPWAIMALLYLIVPFLILRFFVGTRIKAASRSEAKQYRRNTDHGVCPQCKRDFDRPKVKCRCGLILDYPVPNIYGYKYHTCNKGHTISCQSGKRTGLETVCPYCGESIQTREARPITISLVGATGSGKTTLMLSAVDTITQKGRIVDITVESASSGLSKDAIAAKDVAAPTASGELESQIIFLKSFKLKDREIVFNDISGTEFQPDMEKVIFEEYYNYSDGIIFTFDPLALKRGVKKNTPQEIFESFHYMFTTVRRMSPSATSDIPFAIVATKNDILNPALSDDQVRQYLIDNGEENFVRIAESLFTDIRYFSVTSRGADCSSSMRPVWWIVEHVDKTLTAAIPSD